MAFTLEEVTLWVAAAVRPLERRLTAGSPEQFLSELGLPSPAIVAQAPDVVAATTLVGTKVAELALHIPDLADAIEHQDLVGIRRSVDEAAAETRHLLDAVEGLRTAVDASAASAGNSEAAVRAFAAELPERLFGNLFSVHLERTNPMAHDLAVLLGIIELTDIPRSDSLPAHLRRVVRFDRLGPLIDDPFALMAQTYGWGTASFNWSVFSRRLFHLMSATGFVFIHDDPGGGPSALRIALVDVAPTLAAIPGVRATTRARVAAGTTIVRPISADVSWDASAQSEIEGAAAIELAPPADFRIVPPTLDVNGAISIGIKVEDATGIRTVLLGSLAGIRIEAQSLRATAGSQLEWQLGTREATGELVASISLAGGRLVLDFEEADGFLRAILPDGGISLPFDLGLVWSNSNGLHIEGAAGLEMDVPVDLELGPVRIMSLHVGVEASPAGLALETTGSVTARLGPFALAIERMGAETTLSVPDGGGNLGVADLGVRFRPPEGIGLSLDASVVKGGGFLGINEAGTEYSGILELSLGPVSIKAIGILSTEVPGGGWALLLLIYTEFNAVQLGFGFTLTAVGGIIGLQHGIATSILQSGLRTGVLDTLLFPVDPVANAPRLLSQLRVVFPVMPRALTIGTVAKIGWSTPPIATIKLGIVLQFDDVLGGSDAEPQLSRIVLLGQLQVQVPPPDLGDEDPVLIQLVADIVGSYGLREKALAVDSRLRDSHIAGLPLAGSLVVRTRSGSDPAFIVAVGGFHPRFTDLPPGLPAQERVGFPLVYEIVNVRIVGYTALTSNTFQIGADASLLVTASGFRIEALLGFDALFLFEPVFHFDIDFRVSASVKYKSLSLMTLKVTGVLSGPGHWMVTGHASFSLLFWDADIDFEREWGDVLIPARPDVAVRPLLIAALESPDNWQSQIPVGSDALVTLRVSSTGDVLAHPLGELSVLQRVVPLGIDIDKVGNSRPSDGNNFDITTVEIGTPGSAGFRSVTPSFREEHFARGEYLDLSEATKLSTPSFERFRAGVSVSSDVFSAGEGQIDYDPEVETLYLGQPEVHDRGKLPGLALTQMAKFGAASYSKLRSGDLIGKESLVISVEAPRFTLADANHLTEVLTHAGGSQTWAAQAARRADGTAIVVEVAELVSTT